MCLSLPLWVKAEGTKLSGGRPSVTQHVPASPGLKRGQSCSGAFSEEQRAAHKPGEGSLSFGGAHTGCGGQAFHIVKYIGSGAQLLVRSEDASQHS